MSEQQQEFEPVFDAENPHVLKGWEKVNPKNKKPSVSREKVQVFLKYVFEKSKDQLEMELEQDTNYMQMIEDFLEENQMSDKNSFTLEEALQILNWAVDPGEQEDQQQQQQEEEEKPKQQPRSQPKKQSLGKRHSKRESQTQQKQPEKLPKQSKPKTPQQKLQQHQEKPQVKDQENPHSLKQVEKDTKPSFKKLQTPRQTQTPKHQQHQSQKQLEKPKSTHQTLPQHHETNHQRQKSQNQHDWGKVDPSEDKTKKLYKQMNSYQAKNYSDKMSVSEFHPSDNLQYDQIENQIQTPKRYFKQPLSIKKSLAQLNKKKVILKQKDIPLLKLDPTAPEMRYLRKQKIVFKNKKPKPIYHPETTGLQQLFKFYCGLNSQFYSMNRHKDPAKGTFDEWESRMTNLYMHNFMLVCKDFNISENKRTGLKTNRKDSPKQSEVQLKSRVNSKAEVPLKRRSSKGLVPESIQINAQSNKNGLQVQIGQKNKQTNKTQGTPQKNEKSNANLKKEVWDRDKLSNIFKKEADYTLNLKYDKFVQILKTVLKDRVTVEEQQPEDTKKGQVSLKNVSKQQISSKKAHDSEEQEDENQENNQQVSKNENSKPNLKESEKQVHEESKTKPIQIDPVTMAICKFFQVDTQENYEATMSKLRAQYKVNSPVPVPKAEEKPKKFVFEQQHSHFAQDVNEALKARQLQKEQQRMNIKERYLSKFAVPDHDVYSSFKAATNQVNSLNALYGSAPKIHTKQGKCSTVSEGSFGSNKIEYDMRKKTSAEYKMNMSSIIKDARNEIMDATKENKQTYRGKDSLNTEHLSKSRLNGIKSAQNSSKQAFGYKKLHEMRQLRQEEETLSSMLLNNSRLADTGNTSRSNKAKHKPKDISSPLLQRMGCHEEDDLLNKYFDQEKHMQKSNVKLATYLR